MHGLGMGWFGLVWFLSPLCTASSGAMVLWCQTVIRRVQGRTISTIARMSRLFGISKTDWAHSSSLPDSENPRDRTAEHMENRNKWAGRSKDRERTREGRAAKATRLVGLTSAYNPPIAEAGLEGPRLLSPGAGGHFCRALLELPAGTSGTHVEANLQHRAKASRHRKQQSSPGKEQAPGRQGAECHPSREIPPGHPGPCCPFACPCQASPSCQLSVSCSVSEPSQGTEPSLQTSQGRSRDCHSPATATALPEPPQQPCNSHSHSPSPI